jgi:hypothetical protein
LQTLTYEAPLRSHGGKVEELVPANYGVFLFPGHSLKQHYEFIKNDLTPLIMYGLDTLYTDRVVFCARNVDEALLAAIRSDPEVGAVDYDYKPKIY